MTEKEYLYLDQKIKINEYWVKILENQNVEYKKQDDEQQKNGQVMIDYKSAITKNEKNIRTMKEQIRIWKKEIEDDIFGGCY